MEPRFKHLALIIDNKTTDIHTIITKVFGEEIKGRWYEYFKIRKLVKEAELFLAKLSSIENPEELDLPKRSRFKVPPSIDYIAFEARLELESLLTKLGNPDRDTIDDIASLVSIVCYEETKKDRFDSESPGFYRFKQIVLNSPIENVMGVFNWIKRSLKQSQMDWEARFNEVNVVDPDYIQAGGHMMNRYNVINTIKMSCRDFNVSEREAWQLSYLKVQTNILSQSTEAMVQSRMSKIKEKRMEQQRAIQKGGHK